MDLALIIGSLGGSGRVAEVVGRTAAEVDGWAARGMIPDPEDRWAVLLHAHRHAEPRRALRAIDLWPVDALPRAEADYRRLAHAGFTQREVATILGVSIQLVSRTAKKADPPFRYSRSPTRSEAQRATMKRITELHGEGKSTADIVRLTGRPVQTVRSYLRELGLVPNPPPRLTPQQINRLRELAPTVTAPEAAAKLGLSLSRVLNLAKRGDFTFADGRPRRIASSTRSSEHA